MDLTEENFFRIGLLLRALYGEGIADAQDELDPNGVNEEDPSEMIMPYFLYVIKDALEYAGFFGNASKNALKMAARELKMALAKFEMLTQKSQQLTKMQAILEQSIRTY